MENWQQQLYDAGGAVYEVGGTVRDGLLGFESKDRDFIVTGIPLERLSAVLAKHGRVEMVGKSFGVLKFHPRGHDGECHDIALPRTEISTGVGHTEFTVRFDHTLPLEIDLKRRDFTINAMARAVDSGVLIDPYGGARDLIAHTLRQVFPNAFVEDPLRMLRAVQFAARLDLTIESETLASMRAHAALITSVSAERIIEEIGKLFRAEKPSVGFYLMAETGVLAHVFPELETCRGVAQDKLKGDDVFHHTMRVLDAAANDALLAHRADPALLFAALYHDVGKPRTWRMDEQLGRVTFFGHQLVSKRIARKRLRDLKVTLLGVDPDLVCRLVEHHMFETKASFTERAIRRFVSKIGVDVIEHLLDLRLADNRGGKYPNGIKGVLRLRERIRAELAKAPPFGPKDLAITGHDLMTLGVPAGPQMGMILKTLVAVCVDEPSYNTRETLLNFASKLARGEPLPIAASTADATAAHDDEIGEGDGGDESDLT